MDTYTWESTNSGQLTEKRVATSRPLRALQWTPRNRPPPVLTLPFCHGGLELDFNMGALRRHPEPTTAGPLSDHFLVEGCRKQSAKSGAEKVQWLGDLHLLEFMEREEQENF
jgi:hypothetical protein